nr:hypothetical protein [Angustibacter aerolatus]
MAPGGRVRAGRRRAAAPGLGRLAGAGCGVHRGGRRRAGGARAADPAHARLDAACR